LALTGDLRMSRTAVFRVLTALTFVLSFAFSYGPSSGGMSFSPAVLAALGAAGSVWLSGWKPVLALCVVVGTAVALPLLDVRFDSLDLVVVLVVLQVATRTQLSACLLAAAALVAIPGSHALYQVVKKQSHFRLRSDVANEMLYSALLAALAVGIGLQGRRLRETDRQRAISDERRRIARDLHDVAAHHLSALVVHNKLARRLNTPDALDEAASFTAETAADALDSVRRVVQVLNTETGAPMQPQPQLADLDGVIDRMRRVGLDVAADIASVAPVSREAEVAIVRIVQEALANVLRHRGPGRCSVALRRVGDSIELAVEDDGPGTWSASTARDGRTGSYGLLGMRERAEVSGGSLMIGESSGGGWKVTARLPGGRQ
jgi:signal transduction histidine kinase